jgi:hypothetical protein
MCAERDPVDCHRTILIGRELCAQGASVSHILADGQLEAQSDAIGRLVERLQLGGIDMFRSYSDAIDQAYAMQEDAIAFDRDAQIAQRDSTTKAST